MSAVLFDGRLAVRRDVPIPARQPGEALIQMRMAGICGTDIEVMRGYKGFKGTLGHEFVGVVVDAESADLVGRRVCGEINVWCGTCRYCAMAMPTHCERRGVIGILGLDGCFAEYLTLPERNLHVVPDSLSDREAVFAEPLAAAFQIAEQVSMDEVGSTVILGDGRLGALSALALQSLGLDPLVVGKHRSKLQLLHRCGVRTCELTGELPEDVDLVVEATGSSSGLDTALRMTRPRGTVVLKSTVAGESTVDMSLAVVRELTVVGSRCGPFAVALKAMAERRVNVLPLITDSFPLSDGVHALQRAEEKDAIKVLLEGIPA
jgi:threonine dehydrogenase-like Zn-dependent dehydrogenase